MFTGIIEAVGRVCSVASGKDGARVHIDAGGLDCSDVSLGDSIAVKGVCLTVVAREAGVFQADISKETLACVSPFEVDDEVNLEKAMRLADRLGGHLVSGHVDGVGKVISLHAVADNRVLTVQLPPMLARYVARKGSIAMNGVSLTVNDVGADTFSVNLIPHTLAITDLRHLTSGSSVNLEVDMIARYVERLRAQEGQ